MAEANLQMLMLTVRRAIDDLRSYKDLVQTQQSHSHTDLAARIAELGERLNRIEHHLWRHNP